MIPRKFFLRADFGLLKEGSSDEVSSVLDLYSPSDNKKLFKVPLSQKAHYNCFMRLLANTVLPLLFKCSLLLFKCSYLIIAVSK